MVKLSLHPNNFHSAYIIDSVLNCFYLIFAEYGKSQTAYPHQKSEKKKSLEMVRVEKGHVTEETNTSLIRSKTDNSPKSKLHLAT